MDRLQYGKAPKLDLAPESLVFVELLGNRISSLVSVLSVDAGISGADMLLSQLDQKITRIAEGSHVYLYELDPKLTPPQSDSSSEESGMPPFCLHITSLTSNSSDSCRIGRGGRKLAPPFAPTLTPTTPTRPHRVWIPSQS